MKDAKLIFVSPYFQFCLRAEAVIAAASPSSSKEPNKHYSGFSKIVTYYSLAVFLVREVTCMRSNQFWFD